MILIYLIYEIKQFNITFNNLTQEVSKMKVRDLEMDSRDVKEDIDLSRKRDRLVRKDIDKRKTKDRKVKRKQKTRGYYV